MARLTLSATLLCTLASSGCAAAQNGPDTTAKRVPFDVISVRPADPAAPRGIRLTPDGFSTENQRVDLLLNEGFQLGPDELIGEPGWAKSEGWNINAKVAAEDVEALKNMTFDDRRRMFIQVLEERFGLKYHKEKRELPVYALVVAKGGSKMTEPRRDLEGSNSLKNGPGRLAGDPGHITAEGTTTEFLANVLGRMIRRNIVNKTGLTGHYDFVLTWTPELGMAASDGPSDSAAAGDSPGVSVFTAVQEQLGLKLEPQKAMVDVVVVDHLEKPAAN